MSKKVMVVDDDQEFLEELNETLDLSGYAVVTVNNATKVAEEANREKPDVILLDLKMPEKSGFQVADELKHISELAHVPIIVMTAFFKDDYLPLLSICGIHKCLKKPFNPLDVIAQIEEAIHKNDK
ncbi:MAG: response regulator [Candidatus Omnitrophica bacterium]|nr:response regulator [Candidatus Omnitrophota bacterium]